MARKTDKVQLPTLPPETQISASCYQPTDAQKRYCQLLVSGYSQASARKKLRISLETFWAWGMTPGFSPWLDSVLRAETANEIGLVRQALKEQALAGNVAAAKAFLESYDTDIQKRQTKTKKGGPSRQDNYFFLLGDTAPPSAPSNPRIVSETVKKAKVKIS